MEYQFTPGPWQITHWSPSSTSGVTCKEITEGITYYEADGVHERTYGIRADIDPMNHKIQGSFEGAHIADISDFIHQDGGLESKANAHLIAAAPELLEALDRLVKFNEKNHLTDEYATNGPDYAPDTWQSTELSTLFKKGLEAINKALNK